MAHQTSLAICVVCCVYYSQTFVWQNLVFIDQMQVHFASKFGLMVMRVVINYHDSLSLPFKKEYVMTHFRWSFQPHG
jgi:hypothetical protein